ncbi:MAG: lysophospholipid acyltransferase family protein [Verrucomicrobia bacterium]|nr:lysophospholipid acyltransferase family protein [Verrucomicrobiota bacterium]
MTESPPAPPNPFKLTSPFRDPLRSKVFSVVSPALEKVLALDEINQIYIEASTHQREQPFPRRVLEEMNVSVDISDQILSRIPARGPVMVVANHPFGGIEGVILGHLLRTVRPDVKLMANFLLQRIPDLREYFIFVDPFGREASAKANLKPLKETIEWLRSGGMLGVFPAGEVSHIDIRKGGIVDPEWSTTIGRIILKTETPVLPVFFHGSNSLMFQLLGTVHPRFRTAMLPHEFVNKRNKAIHLSVGSLIPFKRLNGMNDVEVMNYLRLRTYHLRHRKKTGPAEKKTRLTIPIRLFQAEKIPVIPPVDPEFLAGDLDKLGPDRKLVVNGALEVYYAEPREIPHILREIGRLRELTFRVVGEGTGQAIDIDRYDDYYLHLFIWNRETREIVGAYRLGKTDVILKQLGMQGLYTNSLFRYRKKLLSKINPALEMGRSFVRVEYQRSYSPLMLLWKGLAQFIVQHPQYNHLFGPVSINNDYHSLSRQLMVAFLKMNNYLPELARLVKARTPMRSNPLRKWKVRQTRRAVQDLDEVDTLVADIEADCKGIPILLRQYLKLGGQLLAFNIDPDFSDVLDGLILVDLRKTERRVLQKYMGPEGTRAFLDFHRLP